MRVTGSEEIGSLKVLGVDIIGEIYFFYGERKPVGSQSIPARCLSQGY